MPEPSSHEHRPASLLSRLIGTSGRNGPGSRELGGLVHARRMLARHRRLLAALLAGATVFMVVHLLAPPPAASTSVLVARHDLAAGGSLQADDVHVVAMPPTVVPAGALTSMGEAVGRTVTGPVGVGEIITSTRLVGPSWVTGLGAGRVAALARMADADAVGLLRVGDRIDVYAPATDAGLAPAVVRSALVASLPESDPARPSEGALVVVAVSSVDAARLAQEASRAPLSFAIVG